MAKKQVSFIDRINGKMFMEFLQYMSDLETEGSLNKVRRLGYENVIARDRTVSIMTYLKEEIVHRVNTHIDNYAQYAGVERECNPDTMRTRRFVEDVFLRSIPVYLESTSFRDNINSTSFFNISDQNRIVGRRPTDYLGVFGCLKEIRDFFDDENFNDRHLIRAIIIRGFTTRKGYGINGFDINADIIDSLSTIIRGYLDYSDLSKEIISHFGLKYIVKGDDVIINPNVISIIDIEVDKDTIDRKE